MPRDNTDGFLLAPDEVSAPSRLQFAISPHDTNPISPIPKAIYIGTGGTITLRGVDSQNDVVLKNVANGQILDIRAQYVRATGTTAADMVGLA